MQSVHQKAGTEGVPSKATGSLCVDSKLALGMLNAVWPLKDHLAGCRFRDNPVVVSEPFIRFYAGAPLIASDGHALGTL